MRTTSAVSSRACNYYLCFSSTPSSIFLPCKLCGRRRTPGTQVEREVYVNEDIEAKHCKARGKLVSYGPAGF
jgi:hypothetical protein